MSKTKEKPLRTSSLNSLRDSIARKLAEIASRTHKYDHQVYEDWVVMMSCALSNGTREDEYLQIVKDYDKIKAPVYSGVSDHVPCHSARDSLSGFYFGDVEVVSLSRGEEVCLFDRI
jgi:hypothetical protein